MKKGFLLILTIAFSVTTFGQKYLTRNGNITFFSSTPLENIEAHNNEVAGVVTTTGEVIFQVPIKSFKFDKELMQEHFNEEYMESDKYPKSDFKGKVTDIGAVNFSKDGSYGITVSGKLTMHGITHDILVPGKITVKGGEITANTKFKVKTEDYGIKIPSIMSGKIAKEIEISVNCVLNAVK